MAVDIERLRYFPRQFLGVEDFQDQQAYHRDMRRRHNLGPHTWGIVAGLELAEQPGGGASGSVDAFIQPGMAVDGFGREMFVLQPTQLQPADFAAFPTQGYYEVWLAYAEEELRLPVGGYQLCDVPDQNTRVRESFRVVVQPPRPTQDPVVVGGVPLFPPPPANPGDPTQPPDGSLPYQQLPDEADHPLWLVRLGTVNWNGTRQQFETAGARLNEQRLYSGTVASALLAPAGALRIADRETQSPIQTSDAGVIATVEGSLYVKRDLQIHAGSLIFTSGADGSGTELPAHLDASGGNLVIDGNLALGGSLRINGGTVFTRVQAGTALVGQGNAPNVRPLTTTVQFASPFANVPKVLALARSQDQTDNPDTFAVTTRAITTTNFKANIVRVDALGLGWGQSLQLDWMAWE